MKTQSRRIFWLAALAISAFAQAAFAAFIQNPSFESNYNTTFPGYGDIDGWTATGGHGVNESTGPFHNSGTAIPDRDRAAFLQGSATLTQTINGLTPGKQYWVQFFYDARNCCGGSIDVAVKFGGNQAAQIPSVKPSTNGFYYFANVAFTPTNSTGDLTLQTVAQGDATVDFDAVTIVQRDPGNVVVANPSFEASGAPTDQTGNPAAAHPGELIAPANMAGWTGTGQYGISLAGGVYADNGVIPDQDLVAFVQGAGALSQVISGLAPGTSYKLNFAYNAQSAAGANAHLQVKIDSATIDDEGVAPVGGTNPYHRKTLTFTPTNATATVTFAQTSSQGVLLLDDVSIQGQVQQVFPVTLSPTSLLLGPTQRAQIQVTVPAQFLSSQSADLLVSMSNTNAAVLTAADTNGVLTLHFARGATNAQTFEVEALASGVSRLQVTAPAGLKVSQLASIEVIGSFVRNPSFEASAVPAAPGYGPIAGWTGGSGLNNASGPFLDNGIVPDRQQIAFLQGSNTLSQQIVALTPGKTYWLQFRYNARAFGGTAVDLKVRFGGALLAAITNITAVGTSAGDNPFYFTNLVFTPSSAAGALEFDSSPTVANADATLLLDAVNIVQRDAGDVAIENPSFEASGAAPSPGYVQPGLIDGWAITSSGYGVNTSPGDAFGDNGAAPDQDYVLFMQNQGGATQTITGLKPGQKYTLIYSVNKRVCCGGATLTYSVSFDNQPLLTNQNLDSVGDGNPFLTQYLPFTPAGNQGVLDFEFTPSGDATLLLDNIRIVRGVVAPAPKLNILSETNGKVLLSWPTNAVGFVLQETPTLPGAWTNLAASLAAQGSTNVVEIQPMGISKFYRLMKSP